MSELLSSFAAVRNLSLTLLIPTKQGVRPGTNVVTISRQTEVTNHEPIPLPAGTARVDQRQHGGYRCSRPRVHPRRLRVDVRRPRPDHGRRAVGAVLAGDAADRAAQPHRVLRPAD